MSQARTEKRGAAGLSRFARRLLREWRRRGWRTHDERVLVAVSGGADSTALLLALAELTGAGLLYVELTAAHLDHGLRDVRAEVDARWVEELARAHGLACVSGRADVTGMARERRDNLEQAARRARYEFLASAARERGAHAVLVAHTLDDQAETVLLRLLRGSGAEGLGGMAAERMLEERREVDAGGGGEVFLRRPLLSWARRTETEEYCRARGVEPRADEMNDDEAYARVRVRRRLLPLLETFNPRAAEALSRAAGMLREDSAALDALAAALLEEARPETESSGTERAEEGAWPLRVGALVAASASVRRRALRLWLARGRGDLRRISQANLLGVERLCEGERGGRVAELPGGSRVERRRSLLTFRREG